jgi:hypothetical protein
MSPSSLDEHARPCSNPPRRHRTRLRRLDQDLSASLPGPFELVESFFGLHTLKNKHRLVNDVFASPASGGAFIYADITIAPEPRLPRCAGR